MTREIAKERCASDNDVKTYFQYYEDRGIVQSTIFRMELSMDRTIHYFPDRTEYGSYDPLFPG